MKKNLLSILSLFFVVLGLWSCEKDESRVTFQGGTAPALTASSTDSIGLAKISKDLPAVSFNWSNPNYNLSTGVSSQNVNYVLQLREKGTTTWVSTASTNSSLNTSITQGDLNGYLVKEKNEGGLALKADSLAVIEARVVSYLGTLSPSNSTNLASNVLTFKVRPYSVIPTLWITGSGTPSSWTNTPPTTQQFTYNTTTKKFTITMNFVPGLEYKFLEIQGQWQPQWGGSPAMGGSIDVNPGGGSDPNAIQTPANPGTYILTVDLINKSLAVTQ